MLLILITHFWGHPLKFLSHEECLTGFTLSLTLFLSLFIYKMKFQIVTTSLDCCKE